MKVLRTVILIICCFIVGTFFLCWLGLKIHPRSFPAFAGESSAFETVSIPSDLPKPVENFYRVVYGEEVPVIKTVVLQGQGIMKPVMNIPFPARFVFVHNTGEDYRHYFEATLFGIPILRVNEGYIDGASFFESPMGSNYDEANANQGANLALWAEAIWFPSVWITDSRVHWEPVDNHTALLFVPYENTEESFVVRFNPETGLIDTMEAMRYRDIGQEQPKILWITKTENCLPSSTDHICSSGSVMWLDQGKPWAYFTVENIVYNADISSYILQKGN
jgi:hypothetical protein